MRVEYGNCRACKEKVMRYPDLGDGTNFHHTWGESKKGRCEKIETCCIPPEDVEIIDDEDLPLEHLDG